LLSRIFGIVPDSSPRHFVTGFQKKLADEPPPSIIQFVSDWAVANGVFKRSKVSTEKKVLGTFLCLSGYTYRDASSLLGGISYVAVHDAYKGFVGALPKLKRKRRLVGIDENFAYLNSDRDCVLWMAKDVDTGEILSLRCSITRSAEDRKKFIDSVLGVCVDRPLLRVGRGPSFPHTLTNLDLYFQIDTTPTIRQRIGKWIMGEGAVPS